jgi:flavin reductase (DIM6/NTAB) family NADH-FMN oxidoreductase RutF
MLKRMEEEMRKNLGAKPFMYPQPVLIIGTYDQDRVANAMNAAWGSIADFKKVALYLSATHKTVKNILIKKEFTVSMATEDQMVACDYVGIVSGNKDLNKLDKTNWSIEKSEHVDAPTFVELPMTLECRMESYDEESELLVGTIINVSVDEKILDDNGQINPLKLKPITFDASNNSYIGLGAKVGNAFKDGNQIK